MYGNGGDLTDGQQLIAGLILGPLAVALLVGLIYRWYRRLPPLLDDGRRGRELAYTRAFLAAWLAAAALVAAGMVGSSLGWITDRTAFRLAAWPAWSIIAGAIAVAIGRWIASGAPVRDRCPRCGGSADFRLACDGRCPRCRRDAGAWDADGGAFRDRGRGR